MALIVFSWLIIACLSMWQGFRVLRTGSIWFFGGRSGRTNVSVALHQRIAYAAVYLFPSVAIVAILIKALARAGVSHVGAWLAANLGLFFFASFFIVIGLLHLTQPDRMLRWTIRTNPELADNRFVLMTTRLIGLGLVLMGIIMVAKL